MLLIEAVLLAAVCSAEPGPAQPTPINPVPRPVREEVLREWTFDRGAEGWVAEHQCAVSTADGLLQVRSTGEDPYLHRPVDLPGGRLALQIRARSRIGGAGAVYWTTDQSPQRGEDKVARFALHNDGRWHPYDVGFSATGRVTDVRIDPGAAPGQFEIDSIRLVRREPHPLTIERVDLLEDCVRFTVKNDGSRPRTFSDGGRRYTLDGGATLAIDRPTGRGRPLEAVSLELSSPDLPGLRRTVFLHHADEETDWIVRPLGELTVQVARDGSLARVRRRGTLVAVLGPLFHREGEPAALRLVDEGPPLRFQGEGIVLTISLASNGVASNEIRVSIDSRQSGEGPVVRVVGSLEQGLFAGLEYLGKGERSSSKLDIETDEHLRFAPDPLKVTMPLMSFVTDRASAAMTWTEMSLQPVFATPNFFDAAADHRMALRGKRIEATVLVDRAGLEETILWAVRKHGLPPLPDPPRSPQQQREICLAALDGPLRTSSGWGHCVQPRWTRQPFADMASTIWRLRGQAPELPRLVHGGAHVRNGTIYFVTGRAEQWLQHKRQQIRGLLSRQQPDGSFRYDGEYRRGHFEDTASGVCARPAAVLLDYAWVTGDTSALRAGLRTLEYMKRFRTPRGAQTWEVPLHTPDQLASAYLVWAYVRGYELTGKEDWLRCARKWALSGVPFTYLWSRYPIMLYSTPPVYGATNWRHSWFGLPVQWVGGVYAYALTLLAPHDDSLDWGHLARGILLCAEQQQYPDGFHVGLLPDSFNIPHQRRQPPDINPCALVSLRLALDGQPDFLCVATAGEHRVAAPFPLVLRDGDAVIRARRGVDYQVIIDGTRIVDVKSQGEDVVPLGDSP